MISLVCLVCGRIWTQFETVVKILRNLRGWGWGGAVVASHMESNLCTQGASCITLQESLKTPEGLGWGVGGLLLSPHLYLSNTHTLAVIGMILSMWDLAIKLQPLARPQPTSASSVLTCLQAASEPCSLPVPPLVPTVGDHTCDSNDFPSVTGATGLSWFSCTCLVIFHPGQFPLLS